MSYLLYTNQAERITAAVPAASLPSKSHTFAISAVGTSEHRIASSVMAAPLKALIRLPAFQALPNR